MIIQDLDFINIDTNKVALSKLKETLLPNRKNEDFRHINLKEIFQTEYEYNQNGDDIKYENLLNNNFYTLVIENCMINTKKSNLSKNMILDKENITDEEYMNNMFLLNDVFSCHKNILSISDSLDKPLLILNISSGKKAFISNNLSIKVDNKAKVDIVEVFYSSDDELFTSVNRSFDINKDTIVGYTKVNIFDTKASLNINNKININSGSLNIYAVDIGSKISINQYDVNLKEKEANINVYSIINIKDTQKIANTLNIQHNNKYTNSNQVFKQILNNKSSAIFNSKITINKDCSYSKAHQNSQTILLDDEARMYNEPRMMIYTDELEASHGASVGSLDENAINYMRLRGLSRTQSEKILQVALCDEIYEYICNSDIRDYIKSII
jgi:Fe-S cluster assembly protein SufD